MMKKRNLVCVCMVAVFSLIGGCGRFPEEKQSVAEESLTVLAGETEEIRTLPEEGGSPATARTEETETDGAQGRTEYEFRTEPLVIELDPGHGGDGGAENEKHGLLEREVNLQIALRLKEELEAYENVAVYLTREDDSAVELEERVAKAADDGADVLISLHNNAAGSICDYYNGCTVLVARGAGQAGLSVVTQELGCYILNELAAAGVENQGLMFRVTQDELYYDDGSLCDYYSIVRNCVKAGIPGIIVEHAFLDSEEDYRKFFADDDKINELALADARGIAGYYHLKRKDSEEVPVILKNHREKITLIVSDYYQDNTYLEKTYFVDK
ncbi:MAG: N-acetylmuramoyl-L-alanine amidase [Lachnospiraceae bacterium]|nr:N-acetylmuramoyl-L-alanine amidase [Lachnospiraceae bacterium]